MFIAYGRQLKLQQVSKRPSLVPVEKCWPILFDFHFFANLFPIVCACSSFPHLVRKDRDG